MFKACLHFGNNREFIINQHLQPDSTVAVCAEVEVTQPSRQNKSLHCPFLQTTNFSKDFFTFSFQFYLVTMHYVRSG